MPEAPDSLVNATGRGSLTPAEAMALIDEAFPQIHIGGRIHSIESLGVHAARVRMLIHERVIRPGNTVSGPAMMTLGDLAVYAALIGTLGPAALQAVTTSFNINFLRRPKPSDMIAEARLLKLGRHLAVGEVSFYSDGTPELMAHATMTYAMPPKLG